MQKGRQSNLPPSYFRRNNLSLVGCSPAEPTSVLIEHSKIQSKLLYLQSIKKSDHLQGNGFDYDFFVENGGELFWDDHHHKFCVIDREVVITGSYNWTYKASNRIQRENIIVITSEKELIDKYCK
jgi:phosphatidylserine/phosphatidylglycerophosphate/cardiolipin synthase-like enzyme